MSWRMIAGCCLALTSSACSSVPQQSAFLMPDGMKAAIVSYPGDGTTPPVTAVITPVASPYKVQVVSTVPVVQSMLQGAVAGAALGGGLAAEGALIRPDRVVNTSNASGQGGTATGGAATGGNATGGTGIGGTACVGTC